MKIIIQTLLRYKTSTILNIVGLSVAFTAFILIATQIRHELTFNKAYGENSGICYTKIIENGVADGATVLYGQIEEVAKLPEIEYVLPYTFAGTNTRYEVNGENVITPNTSLSCTPEYFKVFPFEIIMGDIKSFDQPNYAVVSDDFAKKLFGEESPLGKTFVDVRGGQTITVGAVYDRKQTNTSVERDYFVNLNNMPRFKNNDRKMSMFCHLMVKLVDGVSHEKINQSAEELFKDFRTPWRAHVGVAFFDFNDYRYEELGHSPRTLYILIVIAAIILLVAFVNFVNFASSMVPLKIKNINLRRVVGATKSQVRRSLIATDLTLVFVSFLIAAFLVEVVKDTAINNVLEDISFASNYVVYLIGLGIVIVMGVLAGLYPAFYSTSFSPALLLKGSYVMGGRSVWFRKALIGFQYFVALSFIAIAILVTRQHNLMVNRDGGYVKEGVLVVEHMSDFYNYKGFDALRAELMANPQITDVTYTAMEIGIHSSNWATEIFAVGPKGQEKELNGILVDKNFLEFFGIKTIEGLSLFSSKGETLSIMINKEAATKFGLKLGDKLRDDVEIIGIFDNVNIANMYSEIKPAALMYGAGDYSMFVHAVSYIKVSGNSNEIMSHINDTYSAMAPNITYKLNYMEDVLSEVYQTENTAKLIMQGFSLVAIVIALVGVFGLVAFDTRFRRKEISLRRVNGASVKQIIQMFTVGYVSLIFVAFVVSVPVVYYSVDMWLQSFPYRIEIGWWVFAAALFMVLLLTVVIAIVQSYKSASENPINSLKEG